MLQAQQLDVEHALEELEEISHNVQDALDVIRHRKQPARRV